MSTPSPAVRGVLLAWVARHPFREGRNEGPTRGGCLWTDGVTLAWRARVVARHTTAGPEIWRGYSRSSDDGGDGFRPWPVRELVSHLLRLFPGARVFASPGPRLEALSPAPGPGMLPRPLPTFPRPLGVLEHET